MFISHDVYFIKSIASSVLHVRGGVLTPYPGNYDYYLEKTGTESAVAGLVADGRSVALKLVLAPVQRQGIKSVWKRTRAKTVHVPNKGLNGTCRPSSREFWSWNSVKKS